MGIDVGATTTSAGLVTRDGGVIAAISAPTREAHTNPVDALLKLVAGRVADARARGIALDGIGIGLPGLVDAAKGMMIDSVNFVPEFGQVPLADVIHAETGLPVFVDNDVNALALAERAFGVARDADSLALLAVGTGPGGALIIGDTLVRGHAGCAGEFGHMPVVRDGMPCPCGRRGCLHTVLGGHSIESRGRELARGTAPTLVRALAGANPVTTATVFAAAAAGDESARAIVDEVCHALAVGLATIVNAINPEVIVVTGGVARSLVALEADIRRRIAEHALPRAWASTRLHVVPGDKTRTVLGGAALVHYELGRATTARSPR